jgi:hypothetical protein
MAIGTKVDFEKLILKPIVSSKTVRISFSHFACESMDGASGGARGAPAPPYRCCASGVSSDFLPILNTNV